MKTCKNCEHSMTGFFCPDKLYCFFGNHCLRVDPDDDCPEWAGMENTKMNRKDILTAAIKCVCGDREEDYGSPENSFKAIASMWNSYLYAIGLIENHTDEWRGLTPKDIAAMMVLFKMARVATGHGKADNWIDAAGYAANGGEIESEANAK